jgi:hypothetical protein
MTRTRKTLTSIALTATMAVALLPSAARADVVVNGTTTPAPAPAPAPVTPVAPVVVEPRPAPVVVPAAPAPVVEPAPRRTTTVVEHEPRSYMGTILVSSLAGAVVGVLVGGAIYYLADNQQHANRILYWGAGGVLVGAGVGIIQIANQESRLDRATASTLPTDPSPTYRLALYRLRF